MEGKDLSGLDHESGGHRFQRIPPTEKRGRVHTSTVTVAVFAAADGAPGASPLHRRAAADFEVQWYSGSGAGGQHRNKTQCSCRVVHVPTGTMRKAETRSRESSERQAMTALLAELDRLAADAQGQAVNTLRRGQLGSGQRGDKRRTYRTQDDRVHDQVTGRSASTAKVMAGHFDLLWT